MLGFLVDHEVSFVFQVGWVVLRDGEFQLLEGYRRGLFVHKADGNGNGVDDRLGPGRAAGDVIVDGYDLLHRADDRVGVKPYPAAARAGADGEYQLGAGHGFIGPLQGLAGGAHGRTLAEHYVRMARRAHQLYAETLYVIVGREDIQYFNIAAVAAAAVGVIHP